MVDDEAVAVALRLASCAGLTRTTTVTAREAFGMVAPAQVQLTVPLAPTAGVTQTVPALVAETKVVPAGSGNDSARALGLRGMPHDAAAYQKFLGEIGYLLPEGPDFSATTANVDAEVALIAGPQLVVPMLMGMPEGLIGRDTFQVVGLMAMLVMGIAAARIVPVAMGMIQQLMAMPMAVLFLQ